MHYSGREAREKLGLFWERRLDYSEKQVEIILKKKLDYIVRQFWIIKGAYKLVRQHPRSRELFHT